MGAPHHKVTSETRAEVSALISFGINQEDVAKHLRISVDTLDKHYRYELDTAIVNANAKVAAKLYKKATEDEDLGAIIFWLKTRARWRTEDSKMESESKKQIEADIRQLRERLDEKYKKEY